MPTVLESLLHYFCKTQFFSLFIKRPILFHFQSANDWASGIRRRWTPFSDFGHFSWEKISTRKCTKSLRPYRGKTQRRDTGKDLKIINSTQTIYARTWFTWDTTYTTKDLSQVKYGGILVQCLNSNGKLCFSTQMLEFLQSICLPDY